MGVHWRPLLYNSLLWANVVKVVKMGSVWHLVLSDPDKDPGPVLADSNSHSGPKRVVNVAVW